MKKKILVVEDEAFTAEIIKNTLVNLCYKVIGIAADGREAIAMAEALVPDLVLMDIVLKGKMDGVEAAKAIREKRRIPIVYITGNADIPTIKRARETEPYGYILKPFTVKDVFSAVDTALHRHEFDMKLEKKNMELDAAGEEILRRTKMLEESEQRLRLIEENITEEVMITDMGFNAQYVTPSGLHRRGCTLEELKAVPIEKQMTAESYGRLMKAASGELTHERLGDPGIDICAIIDLEYCRKDGSTYWSESTFKVLRDAEGRAAGILGVGRDISERKLAEEKIRESEERYRTLAESSQDSIYIINSNDIVEYVNYSAAKSIGVSIRDIIGMPRSNFFTGNISKYQYETIQEVIRTGVPQIAENSIKAGGHEILQSTHIIPLTDADGTVSRVMEISRDITKRKLAEKALAVSEDRFRILIQLAPAGIYITDKEGKYQFTNSQWLETAGLTADKAMGSAWLTVVHEDDRVRISAEWENTVKTGGLWNEEYRFRGPNGAEAWVWGLASPMLDAEGRIIGYVGINTDIMERKRAEERTIESLAEKEALLRELYHRTKNNMQVICAMLELQLSHTENREATALFEDMKGRIHTMALVHQMLYQSDSLSSISLRDYVGELTDLLKLSNVEGLHKITLNLDIDDEDVLIDTAISYGMILNELITNAVRHAFPGNREGEISIMLRRKGGKLTEIKVSDNGVGVPPGFDFRACGKMGIQSVFAISEHQLRGKVSFETGSGVTCRIRFNGASAGKESE